MPINPNRRDNSKKIALITGLTGQDGSYLAEFLLHKDYEVHGIIRRSSTFNTQRIDHIYKDPHDSRTGLFFYDADMISSEFISNLIYKILPDEIYNLAAQSHVRVSFDIPEYTGNVNALGTTRILQNVLLSSNKTKFYQASTSELFGNTPPPQDEISKFDPQSPYAISKLYAYFITKNFREAHKLYAVNGILFNHESPRRGETFVTRKITMAVANILAHKVDSLYLGNLDAMRDWGYAPEYIEAMWKMLQQNKPEDLVIGTNELHSVKEFLEAAFSYVGLDWKKYVKTDPLYLRPTEVNSLCSNSSKARRLINWNPKVKFENLVKIMVDADLRKIGIEPPGEGDEFLKRTYKERWWGVD
jgi:GDPmannose 4,6-dehydratase